MVQRGYWVAPLIISCGIVPYVLLVTFAALSCIQLFANMSYRNTHIRLASLFVNASSYCVSFGTELYASSCA
jgi:hypothetical protein